MCDAILIYEEHFSSAQIAIKELDDYTSKYNGQSVVTFKHKQKPYLLPYYFKGNETIEFASWEPHASLEDFTEFFQVIGAEGVEIPAVAAQQSSVWFNVEPRRIRGCLIRRHSDSLIFILVKPASDDFKQMTHFDWEPVYVGEESDPEIFN
ncbi:hypothetical protein [Gimesia fumaroli]|uniref:Uncharacterized protein n=1 Tax=Gimesia fumaroli TaxID=2527976 RepID=A0A518IGD6_9PLAN|nr:hypothetical protein [Gimesia fumaroli]QDV52139.1 hypothetical protein Enr17x_41990 [Gimesia fumaroli]